MSRGAKIAIIGGGIAGPAAALALFRRGVEAAARMPARPYRFT